MKDKVVSGAYISGVIVHDIHVGPCQYTCPVIEIESYYGRLGWSVFQDMSHVLGARLHV